MATLQEAHQMTPVHHDAHLAADHHADTAFGDSAEPLADGGTGEVRPTYPMAQDPVCGLEVRLDPATIGLTHRGWTYHFCSTECRAIFQENRDEYPGAPRFLWVRFLWWLACAFARAAGPKWTLLVVGGTVYGIAVLALCSADTAWWLVTVPFVLLGIVACFDRWSRPNDGGAESLPSKAGELFDVLSDLF
jgi:YHS domain-containing protein